MKKIFVFAGIMSAALFCGLGCNRSAENNVSFSAGKLKSHFNWIINGTTSSASYRLVKTPSTSDCTISGTALSSDSFLISAMS